jgi:hypothetical protein
MLPCKSLWFIDKKNSLYKNNPELTITINGLNILMSLVGLQSTSDGKKIWKIKLKIGKRITKHMRVCWKHFVDEDFVPLVCWFDGLFLCDSFEVRYAAQQ